MRTILFLIVFFSLVFTTLTTPKTSFAGMMSPSTISQQTANVSIANFAFNPSTTTVNVGDQVTWINMDPVTHTVTSDTGSFDSGTLNPGQSFSVQFTNPGTYSYHCQIHPNMMGTVVVQGTMSKTPQVIYTGGAGTSPSPNPNIKELPKTGFESSLLLSSLIPSGLAIIKLTKRNRKTPPKQIISGKAE